ncbi:MAG: DUF1822 family protein [Candidatus Gastranaerophilaceae bacterium]
MGFEQNTLIYIEENDKVEASLAAKGFADEEVKNRAYINALGAELALKYLTSENISINNIHNLHSVKKILEETDISDIMLPNIHIDVRVVFDENFIFIPKSHFEYNLVPDIYLVFNLAEDFTHVKFLGFFEPRLINKNNANDKYYFIEKEKLNSPIDLKNFIQNFNGNTTQSLSESDLENSERIMIAMVDNDITESDKKYLLQQLTKCADLRDKFIEFENFELLSYSAINDDSIIKNQIKSEPVEDFSDLNTVDVSDLTDISDPFADEMKEPSLDEFTPEPELTENNEIQTNNNEENILGDIAALGTAAALGAGAAMTAEGITGALDGIELAKDGLDILDKGIDLGLDALDTLTPDSNIEAITSEPETNSLKNEAADLASDLNSEIEPSIDLEQDFEGFGIGDTEPIENNAVESLSFDDIDTTTLDDILPSDEEVVTETLSLDNVDTTNLEESIDTEINNNIETMSFDNIADFPEEVSSEEIVSDTTLSFDDINLDEIPQTEVPVSEIGEDNKISFDNMDMETSEEEDINISEDNLLDLSIPEELTSDIESDVPLMEENIEMPEDIQEESNIVEENLIEETNEIPQNEAPQDIQNEIGELIPDINTIDVDNLDEIGIPLDSVNIPNAEDISSNNLLDEIDNILNTSELQNQEPEQETEPIIEEPVNEIPDTSIEDILGEPINSVISETDTVQNVSDEILPFVQNEDDDDEITSMIDALETKYINEESENTVEASSDNNNEKLEVLFNDTDSSEGDDDEIASLSDIIDNAVNDDELPSKTPGAALFNKKESAPLDKNKKMIIVAAALVALVASASVFTFLKSKSGSADIENLAQNPGETDTVNQNLTPLPSEEISENTDNLMTNTPDINSIDKKNIQTNQTSKELKNSALSQKPVSSESYLSVQKLVWDVPDYLSYSPKMKNYLTTAGKSIKLSLSADLLLATEYAYSNQVKVNLKLSNDGTIQNSQVVTSSGSEQIDKIVLQSVKDTLNVVKPPSGEVKGPDFNLSLIIYF